MVTDDDDGDRLLALADEVLRAEHERVDAEELAALRQHAAAVHGVVTQVLARAAEVKALRPAGRVGRQSAELLEWLFDDLAAAVAEHGGHIPAQARRPGDRG